MKRSIGLILACALCAIVASCSDKGADGARTPEAVDLGLSVKWADCNLGATSVEDDGDYFSWAETAPKAVYNRENYTYLFDSPTAKYTHLAMAEGGEFILKLEKEDDAASVILGKGWRLPTPEEAEELLRMCKWTRGENGFIATGPNGMSINFPDTGKMEGEKHVSAEAAFWTSELASVVGENGNKFYSDKMATMAMTGIKALGPMYREFGITIRPVCE